ncbi:hypothetical protein HDIA_0605 [Hartmannibacter diazotrophicus]|uniref:Calpastatin n=1 Tax=Hartmannibacter diazotrophicus TaxID=1482074 RepID=A0A2C9D1M7_9HYPH|nr:DUF1810 domain-containing protein [Hartmannibacter diazotrophicus]SON54146.1 hypothetical protein HDIA_0605 [Hartmannibacter diazotrophicus]
MDEPFDLARFIEAQDRVYETVLEELHAGRKVRHWMWFVFPQIAGLGSSGMARRYAISSLDEAKAYLAHPLLSARLDECTHLVLATKGLPLDNLFGSIDTMKFRSSMTLFDHASEEPNVYGEALEVFFDGERDWMTLARLKTHAD